MNIIRILIALTLLTITGCATSSPIKRYKDSESSFRSSPELISHNFSDNDIYRIYHRAATGFVSIQSIRQSAEARAEKFAERQGKTIRILGEKISEPPYILGNFPRIEIIFALVNNDELNQGSKSKYDDLEKLKDLFDKGILTESEYNDQKSKILR
jgi:hypothetical protein